MAGLSAGGIGSGLDINSLVAQLVSAERAPLAQRLNRVEAGAKFKLSAVATVSSAFDGLKRALDTLRGESAYGGRKVVSGAEALFTATAGTRVPTGSYEIEVLAVASAPKLVSAPIAEEAGLGPGTLRLSVGEASFEVEVGADHTPVALRDAINAAAGEAGARLGATLIRGDDGKLSLSISGQQTGAANAIRIEQVAGSGDLGAFTFDPADPSAPGMDQRRAAADAQVRIDGVLRSSPVNQVSDAIEGLTLNLLKAAEPGAGPSSLSVTADNSATRSAVQALVAAYNATINALAGATRYNAATGEAGALNGDAQARGATSALRNAFASAVGDLAGLGLSGKVDGTLVLDADKLGAALADDPARVESLLRGFGDGMGQVVSRYVGTDGSFALRSRSLNDQVGRVQRQREDLDRRMESVEARYLRQFTALDTLIAQLGSTSNFLSQQLSSLQALNQQR